MLALLAAAALPAIAASVTAPAAAEPGAASDLDAARRECIAAASGVQRREREIAALAHNVELLERDLGGRKRGLDESRTEQAQLLGEIERFAHHPPGRFAAVGGAPIDRVRSDILLRAVEPALRAQARALAGEVERVGTLRAEIAARQGALAATRQALADDRQSLAQSIARRAELARRRAPAASDSGNEARGGPLAHEAKDIGDLAKRAEAAAERRDKELLTRVRATLPKAKAKELAADGADPARPHELRPFDPPDTKLTMPIAGAIGRAFGAADASGAASQGLRLDVAGGAAVVAPFDGRVIYAGPFGSLGLVLIIRHGGLYHSLLAGLARTDVRIDDWVLAGEPVGAMPEMAGRALYFELRRDGRPVDPQPWLASDDGRRREPDRQDGDQKVRE